MTFEESLEQKWMGEEKLLSAKEIAQILLKDGLSLQDVIEATGLSQEDVRPLLH
ncbi:hypothetical protein [Candidatus Williamhamiltonella defendens]|uniref:hypothetical protein n=1 Tax=Candidatus Williamhamiltonella defendens TaxID=138072 RepID=UPI001314D239|nr:hypothetical protein [Candidatus Hamiltonella defensa]